MLAWPCFVFILLVSLLSDEGTSLPVGTEASALKRRKRKLLMRHRIPPDALPGSLVLSHRRCGKPSCHCAEGAAHPFYSLTFMVDGNKHVESVPAEWIDAVRPAVDAARGFKDAVSELLDGILRRVAHCCLPACPDPSLGFVS